MKTKRHLRKWVKTPLVYIAIISGILSVSINDFEFSIVGIGTVLMIWGLFIGSAMVLHKDTQGWQEYHPFFMLLFVFLFVAYASKEKFLKTILEAFWEFLRTSQYLVMDEENVAEKG